MEICEKYKICGMYDVNSQVCNENSIARGYCGIRKNEVAPLIKKELKRIAQEVSVSVK